MKSPTLVRKWSDGQKWTKWFELHDAADWPDGYGIYRVRMTDRAGKPYGIARLCGVDPEGLLYVGRSGFSTAKTLRTLGVRLQEFHNFGPHSGSGSYWQACEVFEALKLYKG